MDGMAFFRKARFALFLLAYAILSAIVSAIVCGNRAQALTVVYSNDVMGDIEPCGCRNNPQGGMARKANLLKRLQDDFILQVDAGDSFYASSNLPELLAEQSFLQAGYLLKAMEKTNHQIAVPGEKDFSLGVKKFEALIEKSKVQFLAANLVRKKGGQFLKDHAILTQSGLKVGVFGLVGAKSLSWPRELKVLDPIESAKKQLKALRGKVDLIVAVTHQGFEEDQNLAARVPGIDLIVGAHSQSFLQIPARLGSTTIVQSSFRNQYVGVIRLGSDSKKTSLASALKNDENYKLVGLDVGYESPADSPSEVDLLVKEFKKAVADLNTAQEKESVLQAVTSNTKSLSPGFHTFGQCAGCHSKQFDFWRKTKHVTALTPLLEKGQDKNKECMTCHTVGLGEPGGYTHVDQLAEVLGEANEQGVETTRPKNEEFAQLLKKIQDAGSLQEKVSLTAQDKSPQPLFLSVKRITRAWAPVQCESCHGAGGGHPFSSPMAKKVPTETCLKCHTPERAPTWYTSAGQLNTKLVEEKRPLVTCPAGDLDLSNSD